MIFKKYRFTSKLMITYLLLTVIPMTLIGYLSYVQYTRSIETQVGKYVPRILSQANSNLDSELEKLQNIPDLIYNSKEVMGVLRKDSYQSQSRFLQDQFLVESFLSRAYLSGNNSNILGVFIVSKNRIFQNTRKPYKDFDFEQNAIPYAQELDFRGKVNILLPYEANLRFEGDIPYLLIVKQINDFDNRKNLGTMFMAVTLTFFENILDELSEGDSAKLWIMNPDGRIVYHTDSEQIGKTYEEISKFPIHNGSFKKKAAEGGELFSVSESKATRWMLVHHIPIKELTSQTDRLRNVTIFVFILFVAITGAISVLLAWNFTRPLNKLSRLMKDVQKGNFQVDLQINSRDEVGILAYRFNAMVKEIRELILENYQIEIKQKEAELYALQYQINPHFMYNTLETISMAVEENEKDKVVEMVTLIGRMLRFSLSNKKRIVPIAEEVQHAEDFLQIQKYRFEDALEYTLRSSIETENFFTPKFILQPILENGIKHGLEHRQKVRIEIEIGYIHHHIEDQDAIQFTIKDNGIGMNADQLAQVRNLLRDSPSIQRDSGFGLVNVHSRIALKFGEHYGLQIHSREGEGTVTTIVIPVLHTEEANI